MPSYKSKYRGEQVDAILDKMASYSPDWNQSDSTQPDYIKNRPFYDDIIETKNESVTLNFEIEEKDEDEVFPRIEARCRTSNELGLIVGQTYDMSLKGYKDNALVVELASIKSDPVVHSNIFNQPELEYVGEFFVRVLDCTSSDWLKVSGLDAANPVRGDMTLYGYEETKIMECDRFELVLTGNFSYYETHHLPARYIPKYSLGVEHFASVYGILKQITEDHIPDTIARVADVPIYKGEGEHSATIGTENEALGFASFAVGLENKATNNYSIAEGGKTTASGKYSHAEGAGTQAIGNASHSEGAYTQAIGENSHAEGNRTEATGRDSHAEGVCSDANGIASHSEGHHTKAVADYSHAEGNMTQANGAQSHAEGKETIAQGNHSHAEGAYTKALAGDAHAEGAYTEANGENSHAEGYETIASGRNSHAEGYKSMAVGSYSHAEGLGTQASGQYQHAQGTWNIIDTKDKYAHIVGNGTDSLHRSNAHTLDWNGNAWYAGSIEANNINSEFITLKSPNGSTWKIGVSNDGYLMII